MIGFTGRNGRITQQASFLHQVGAIRAIGVAEIKAFKYEAGIGGCLGPPIV